MTEQTPPAAASSLESRVESLEHALASLAAPQLSQSDHDGHFLLSQWFAGLKARFLAKSKAVQERIAAEAKAAEAKAKEAASKPAAPIAQ